MHPVSLAVLIALLGAALVSPTALAHEPSPAELETMINAVSQIAWAARTWALVAIGIGVLGLASAALSLALILRRK